MATPDTARTRRETFLMSQWFEPLSAGALDYLADHSRLARLAPDELILSRSDKMTFVAVVRTGGLRNIITTRDGNEHAGPILRAGSFYGSVGVLNDIMSPHDIVADGKTEIVRVEYQRFRYAMSCFPDLTLLLAKVLTHRLRRSYTLSNHLSLDSLEARIRRMIVILSSPETGTGAENTREEIRIKQEDLGHYVRSSRPTINKVLKELERLGVIELGYGVIRIINREALCQGLEPRSVFYY